MRLWKRNILCAEGFFRVIVFRPVNLNLQSYPLLEIENILLHSQVLTDHQRLAIFVPFFGTGAHETENQVRKINLFSIQRNIRRICGKLK